MVFVLLSNLQKGEKKYGNKNENMIIYGYNRIFLTRFTPFHISNAQRARPVLGASHLGIFECDLVTVTL